MKKRGGSPGGQIGTYGASNLVVKPVLTLPVRWDVWRTDETKSFGVVRV